MNSGKVSSLWRAASARFDVGVDFAEGFGPAWDAKRVPQEWQKLAPWYVSTPHCQQNPDSISPFNSVQGLLHHRIAEEILSGIQECTFSAHLHLTHTGLMQA